MLSMVTVTWKLDWRWRICFPDHLAYWQASSLLTVGQVLNSLRWGSLHRLPEPNNMAASFPQRERAEGKRLSEMKATMFVFFKNLIVEVTHHHCCYVLSAIYPSTVRGDFQRAHIPGDKDHWHPSWWLVSIPIFLNTAYKHICRNSKISKLPVFSVTILLMCTKVFQTGGSIGRTCWAGWGEIWEEGQILDCCPTGHLCYENGLSGLWLQKF